ncbi:MAG TPA: prenyltransferase/squalene oxidase repeat-containing protein [Candidatus Cybelea sp.]|nr:prenyltransferase/squalene oxidase repeat-containing protein [Candidatus Cybelea sp.]
MPTSGDDSLSSVCLAFLRAAQNEDGGWGFHKGAQSRVEPTCWALFALRELESAFDRESAGLRFLRSTQLSDGSWPACPSQTTGCWVTSLASWVLSADARSRDAVAAGLRWIINDWPGREPLPARIIRKLFVRTCAARQNDSLRAWGWTPGTASWVEPTAFALLAIEHAPKELVPAAGERRRAMATAMLYDRMCPEGGWNCGNPMVYGVPGQPLIEPTAWALLALRRENQSEQKIQSLRWLSSALANVSAAGSLALAEICLEAYGVAYGASAPNLRALYRQNQFLGNVQVMAWTCLALGPRTSWFGGPANAHA